MLLNDVLMCAWPIAMFFRTRRRVRPRVAALRGGAIYFAAAFLPRPTVFFGPLRVRAFVFVRWPLHRQAAAVAEAAVGSRSRTGA